MTCTPPDDWNPESYRRYGALRLRPALDLIAQVPDLPGGPVFDVGCGPGGTGQALAARFGGAHEIVGLDASPVMLEAAARAPGYDRLVEADAAVWTPEVAPALIFSNAAMHWLPHQDLVLRRLAAFLAPGGTLAVQMPRQFGAPSHRFLREFAAEMFPDRFGATGWKAPVGVPVDYHRLLSPLGAVAVWETDYVHRLDPAPEGHPVRRFTEATVMRPFLSKLDPGEAEAFTRRYDKALASAYPIEPDGAVLFPFRRLFFVLTVKEASDARPARD